MRTSSNPVFKNLPKGPGGYATFGSGAAGASNAAFRQGQQQYGADQYQTATPSRAMTVDDVVTKTGTTLVVLTIAAALSYFMTSANPGIAPLFVFGGMIVGLVLVLVAVFGKKMDNPGIVLSYAVAQGLFLGGLSWLFANVMVSPTTSAGALIGQAVLGTFGVFFGMLFVYKTGAIRVTPRMTRMVVAGIFGALVLMIGNLVAGFFMDGGLGLRDGGPLAIIFSLFVIGLAAFSFLIDFDAADEMIRQGAPEKSAWAVAFGLTITLVWLYIEILRLLSYFNQD
ncbi:Bax inhibitor-1/YccA family protein [Hoyosella rhizosphaerae]|uniref:Membrane protein n=1 Tax=Hoyosella rhizosphaerae TaxID=1755582 RepID=A0A916XER5_9ACTN|nr:Bax inhibitor-1/YccA family protein [Hoyosella rhizosphaerae]MBN4925715.1 Bax inhibitor-1/YccA family protein [Hoyosella rhizosphaerae]GGC68521.1 membrane protein [Hoyosella rhizosphaerae]